MSRIAEAAFGDKPFSYPDTPGAKATTTSREAAAAVSPTAGPLRDQVYAEIAGAGMFGMTADEVGAKLKKDWRSIRPRVSELSALGRIVDSGERRKNDTDLNAIVWRVV
jgi:hypothetical protein